MCQAMSNGYYVIFLDFVMFVEFINLFTFLTP